MNVRSPRNNILSFKERMTATFFVIETDILLESMDGYN